MGCKLLFASTKVFASSDFDNVNLEFVNYFYGLQIYFRGELILT